MDTVKKAFKGLFKKKDKSKKPEATPIATTAEGSTAASTKPTETTPPAPAPATAPATEAKTETTPAATEGKAPAAPAPGEGEVKKEEAKPTEVKEATASTYDSHSTGHGFSFPMDLPIAHGRCPHCPEYGQRQSGPVRYDGEDSQSAQAGPHRSLFGPHRAGQTPIWKDEDSKEDDGESGSRWRARIARDARDASSGYHGI